MSGASPSNERTAASCRAKCHVDVVLNPVGGVDAAHPFAAALKQLQMVEFLESIAVEIAQRNVLDEGHHGH